MAIKLSFVLLLLSVFASNLPAQTPAAPKTAPARPSATGPVIYKDLTPGLPCVLIIGDSISMGYTKPVQTLLAGKANVHRIPVNGGPTKNGTANIERWLGAGKWDVIHFNWGIHDLKVMPEGTRQVEPADYEANLRALVERMKKTGAKLIWATTTPIPDGELNPSRKFGKVPEYNEIAAKVMKEEGVPTNDLNTWITPKLAEMQNPKDVHYKPAGSEYLGQKVAEEITAALKK